MNIKDTAAVLLAALTASACTEAHMRAPAAPPGAVESAVLTGVGGRQSGGFDLAGAHGNFVRSGGAYRERDFTGRKSPVLFKDGESQFTIWGEGIDGRLSGDCGSQASEFDAGRVSIGIADLSYRCRFQRDGAPIDARLELAEPRSAKLLAPRAGFLFFRGRRMEIRSVHDFEEPGVLRSGTAAGYAFLVDGQEIGGIDLANAPYRVYLPRDPAYREAAMAASLAMALFYDPENMVGEETFGPDY